MLHAGYGKFRIISHCVARVAVIKAMPVMKFYRVAASKLRVLSIAFVFVALGAASAQTNSETYPGNTRTGFGGTIGTGSLTLSSTNTNLTLSWTTNSGSGGMGDFLVFYFDTTSGGAASLPDGGGSADAHRRAVVNVSGSGITDFPGTFTADYGLAINTANGAFAYSLAASGNTAANLTFAGGYTLSGSGTAASPYSLTIGLTDLALTSGETFQFVTTYLNPSDGGSSTFRSNEGFGANDFGATNPGTTDVNFTTASSFTVVPEPSTWAAGILSILAVGFTQRRRLAGILSRK